MYAYHFAFAYHLVNRFKYAWADIDTKGTGYIQKEDVAKFLRKLTGKFQLRIYDDINSVPNIIKASRLHPDRHNSTSMYASPKSPSEKSPGEMSKRSDTSHEFNTYEINRNLSKMDIQEVRKRRMEYNLYYKVRNFSTYNDSCINTICLGNLEI